MKLLIEYLVHKLVQWCIRNNRVFHITGDGQEDVYLVRYIVFKSKWGCFYIHRFMRSDASDPHDHPWNFFTYIVSGGYEEHFFDVSKPVIENGRFESFWRKKINVRKAGSLAYRRATDIHRVVIPQRFMMKDIQRAPLTACIMFKRKRHWGFWSEMAKGGVWTDWRDYLMIKPNDPRTEGSE